MGIDGIMLKARQVGKYIERKVEDITKPKKQEMYLIAIPEGYIKLFSVNKTTGTKTYALRMDLNINITGNNVYGSGEQTLQEFLDKNAVLKCMELTKKGIPKLLKDVNVEIRV